MRPSKNRWPVSPTCSGFRTKRSKRDRYETIPRPNQNNLKQTTLTHFPLCFSIQPRKASATCSSATAATSSGFEEWGCRSPRQRSSAPSPEHPGPAHPEPPVKPPSPAGASLVLPKPPSPCAPGLYMNVFFTCANAHFSLINRFFLDFFSRSKSSVFCQLFPGVSLPNPGVQDTNAGCVTCCLWYGIVRFSRNVC